MKYDLDFQIEYSQKAALFMLQESICSNNKLKYNSKKRYKMEKIELTMYNYITGIRLDKLFGGISPILSTAHI